MSHIIKTFGSWKKVNEQDTPGRERETGTNSNKVVAIPVDKNTLKLKIVNDADIIDGNGKLTIGGFDALLTWLGGQREIINYYTALTDLTSNIVVYNISRDTGSKQVILFKIYSKSALKGTDQNVPGINPQVRFVRQDELSQALGGTILNTKEGQNITAKPATSTSLFSLPFPAASIQGSTDARVISFIITAYNKIKKDSIVIQQPIMAKVKAEASAKRLGPASALFIKSLNAGFGILDAQFKEDTETDITKTLFDKINAITESKETYLGLDCESILEVESTVIPGFDVDAFAAIAKTMAADTKGITVPEVGFTYGTKGNTDLQKFQDILLKNLPIYAGGSLKNAQPVASFLRTKADGIYGNGTRGVIKYLKAGLSDPKYPDNDANVIKPDFVNRMLKEFKLITESTSTYLGLDGYTVIVEGFDVEAANTATGTVQNSNQANRGGTQRQENTVDNTIVQLGSNSEWEYKVVDGIWNYRKIGSGKPWSILTNPKSIKELIKNNKKGAYANLDVNGKRVDKRLYKIDGDAWKVYLNGKWNDLTNQDTIKYLNNYYKPTKSGTSSSVSSLSIADVDGLHKKIAKTIKGWFPEVGSEGPFAEFKSSKTATVFSLGIANDDETGAWEEFKRLWSTGESSIKVKLVKAQKGIDLLNGESKRRCQKNQDLLAGIIKDGGKFKEKFMGGTTDDNFTISLYQADGSPFKVTIDTDI
jgi:hypothetical protein